MQGLKFWNRRGSGKEPKRISRTRIRGLFEWHVRMSNGLRATMQQRGVGHSSTRMLADANMAAFADEVGCQERTCIEEPSPPWISALPIPGLKQYISDEEKRVEKNLYLCLPNSPSNGCCCLQLKLNWCVFSVRSLNLHRFSGNFCTSKRTWRRVCPEHCVCLCSLPWCQTLI